MIVGLKYNLCPPASVIHWLSHMSVCPGCTTAQALLVADVSTLATLEAHVR